MTWTDQIFRYCERGQDASFWAEPVNAITNIAFLAAAVLAAVELARTPDRPGRGTMAFEAGLVAVVFAMGVGSFLFHTYATVWSSYADTIPIGVFMLAYFAFVLGVFLGLHWIWVATAVAAFAWTLQLAGSLTCAAGPLAITSVAANSCLNGTLGYVPAWIALVALAAILAVVRHPAWRYLAAAGLTLLASMTFRTFDFAWCEGTRVAGHAVGTHFLWHLLNALTLYILLLAAIRHGRATRVAA